jgi:hypothetical protein
MQVKVIRVEGLDIACEAVRLSFNSESNMEIVEESQELNLFKDDLELLKKLVVAGDSHAKVLRMATVWLDITMPRYWYSEFDTYKQGTVAMSESTAHKLKDRLKKREITEDDFEHTSKNEAGLAWIIDEMTDMVDGDCSLEELKQMLPEAFLQRRIVCTNYQTLRHIYFDRRNHRLPIWHKFLDELLMQLPFPEFITIEKEK